MKNRKNLGFALLVVLLFASCPVEESIGITVIKIANHSSHNLHLTFESDSRLEFADVDIVKNQSFAVEGIVDMTYTAYDPNFELESVTFLSMDTHETLVEKSAQGLFVFESRERFSNGDEKAVYSLTITDEMLEP